MPKKDISEELDCNPWKMTRTGWIFVALALLLIIVLFFVMWANTKKEPIDPKLMSELPVMLISKETLEKTSSTLDPKLAENVSQETLDNITSH